MSNEFITACDRVVSAAINSTYQGILIVALVALGLKLLMGTNAATRHAVWLATLGLVVALFPAHLLLDGHARTIGESPRNPRTKALPGAPQKSLPPKGGDHSEDQPHPTLLAEGQGERQHSSVGVSKSQLLHGSKPQMASGKSLPDSRHGAGSSAIWFLNLAPFNEPGRENAFGGSPFAGQLLIGPVPTSMEPHTNLAPALPQTVLAGNAGKPKAGISSGSSDATAEVSTTTKGAGWLQAFLRPASLSIWPGTPRFASVALLGAWLAVAGTKFLLLLWRLRVLRKMKRSTAQAGEDLRAQFHRLRQELRLTREVALKLSAENRSPVLVGFVRPAILLPAAGLAHQEVDSILRHELAHLRRRDDWANLLQHLVQAWFFFHPAVWWISPRLSIEREIACDDFVLEQGGSARAYALLLANFASRLTSSRPLLAPGVTTSKKELKQRIDMILNPNRNTSPRLAGTRLGFVTSAAALLAVLALCAAPRLVLAQTATAGPAASKAHPVVPAVAAAPPAAVIAEVPATPPVPALPEPPDSDRTPPAGSPFGIQPGPKAKPGDALPRALPPGAPVPLAMPAPLEAPVPHPPLAATPPLVAVAPHPPMHLQPGVAVNAPPADSSFEQRLRRLEELVQSLMHDREARRGRDFQWSFKREPGADTWMDQDKVKQLQQMAERQAARAAEQVDRANKELEKSLKAQKDKDGKMKMDSAKQHLEALNKQREMLQREMEKLQQQIERIEQEQEKLQQREEKRRGDLLNEEDIDDSEADLALPETAGAAPELAKLQLELKELLTRYTGKHPAVQQKQQAIAVLEGRVDQGQPRK